MKMKIQIVLRNKCYGGCSLKDLLRLRINGGFQSKGSFYFTADLWDLISVHMRNTGVMSKLRWTEREKTNRNTTRNEKQKT